MAFPFGLIGCVDRERTAGRGRGKGRKKWNVVAAWKRWKNGGGEGLWSRVEHKRCGEEEEEEEERDLKASFGSKSNGIIMGEAPRIEGFNFGNGCAFGSPRLARNISGNISGGGALEERSRQKICEFRRKISLFSLFLVGSDLNTLVLKSKEMKEIDQREVFWNDNRIKFSGIWRFSSITGWTACICLSRTRISQIIFAK